MKFLDTVRRLLTPRSVEPPPPPPTLIQRRQHTRVDTHEPRPTAWCVWDDGREQVALHDISASGARVVMSRRLEPGTALTVGLQHPDDFGSDIAAVRAVVVWARKGVGGHEAGLEYLDARASLAATWVRRILLEHGLRPETSVERRRYVRVPTDCPASLEACGERLRVQLVNLSLNGALLDTVGGIPGGRSVTLHLETGGRAAAVSIEGFVLKQAVAADCATARVSLRFPNLSAEQETVLRQHLFLHLEKAQLN